MTINELLNTLTNNTPLPMELWLKIVYKHKGFMTPCALLIKNHMEDNKLIEYTQLAYYVKYENFKDISESLLDTSTYHITRDLINIKEYMEDEENKYEDFWTGQHWEISNGFIRNGETPLPMEAFIRADREAMLNGQKWILNPDYY